MYYIYMYNILKFESTENIISSMENYFTGVDTSQEGFNFTNGDTSGMYIIFLLKTYRLQLLYGGTISNHFLVLTFNKSVGKLILFMKKKKQN